MQHLDAVKIDAKDFVCDLRQRRFVPLAVRVGADADLDASIRGQSHGRLFISRHDGTTPSRQHCGSHCTLLAEDREPDADEARVRLAAALTLAGCAGAEPDGAATEVSDNDPIEPVNRAIFDANMAVDAGSISGVAKADVVFISMPSGGHLKKICEMPGGLLEFARSARQD